MAKRSQRKGRGAEIELAKVLNSFGIPARPGRPVSYGQEPDVVGLDGCHVEVKRCEQTRLDSWMDQSIKDAERFDDGLPVVIHRRSRRPWMVSMMLTDWLKLYEGWHGKAERDQASKDFCERP